MKNISLKQKIVLIIFGALLSIILLEIGLRAGGGVFTCLRESGNPVSVRQKGEYRIMCLGESTTGLGGEASYPRQLERILNERNADIKFSVINKGLPGLYTVDILERLEDNIEIYKPDMVVAMMGINDEKAGYGRYAEYADMDVLKKGLFFKNFRAYKLIKLLYLNISKIRPPDPKAVTAGYNSNDYLESGMAYYEKRNYKKAEEMFEASLAIEPNIPAYVKLGDLYKELGKYENAEDMLKKALKINPLDSGLYVYFIKLYTSIGDFGKVKRSFKKALLLDRKNSDAYFALGWYYVTQENYAMAEILYNKALDIDPVNHPEYYSELTRFYDCEKLEPIYRKAVELNPDNYSLFIKLGKKYYGHGNKGDRTEELFKKALKINPRDPWIYAELGEFYTLTGDHRKAEEAYNEVLKLDPGNQFAYGGLAICFKKEGNDELSDVYFKKANNVRLKNYPPILLYNYRKLKKGLLQKNIKLVCVQYPIRSVEPLKKIVGENENTAFVDNEGIFKKAIEKEGYDEYFTDSFGGDFGHCTPKGNRLLAENIATMILKKYFK